MPVGLTLKFNYEQVVLSDFMAWFNSYLGSLYLGINMVRCAGGSI